VAHRLLTAGVAGWAPPRQLSQGGGGEPTSGEPTVGVIAVAQQGL